MDGKIASVPELEEYFGYEEYFGASLRTGWLLTYNIVRNETSEMKANLYFVDEKLNNFRISIPHYASLLVSYGDALSGDCDALECEEFFRRRYGPRIFSITPTEKIDAKMHNHLNTPPRKFLRIRTRREDVCMQIIRDMLAAEKVKNPYDDITLEEGYKVHEYDIPQEVSFANENNLRAGLWYSISYNGQSYTIQQHSRITYPDLRVMAFDIETTKPPLKFPNPNNDQVMMISVMTESFGELIVNRTIVSQDISEFEYRARSDMARFFRTSNESDEESLLLRFIELIQNHRPHIIVTFNGGFFDFPFVDKRAAKYGISLKDTVGIIPSHEYYDSPFIMHMDCYKWVKRDSYLPMNNHGLKAVTKVMLGYFPDEIDPEDMMQCAKDDPQKLASYSVSDAVATYFLYEKYVHSHIFSISSLIPMQPVQILCRGSGTLCETLLISEAARYGLLIPPKKKNSGLVFRNGRVVECQTYVGGHVESLHAGIFRSDFKHNFEISPSVVAEIDEYFSSIFSSYVGETDFLEKKAELMALLQKISGKSEGEGAIYHLDVAAMYPNIILTNRMQPDAIVTEDNCVHCDFNSPGSQCKRKMTWVSRTEVYPPSKNEVKMLTNQLESEYFPVQGSKAEVPYLDLPVETQEKILRERLAEYSKKIYKKTRVTETLEEEVTVCQREIPFYVNTVRMFRDQRYIYKDKYKEAVMEYEAEKTAENKKKVVAYKSLQVAYKCVLNSFYGYVMRVGSRWFSLEMAAAVCHVGGEVIRRTKEYIERIGIPLELDTDGIWCILPRDFPSQVVIGNTKISVLSELLNYFVCKKFTNNQYHTFTDGSHSISDGNSNNLRIISHNSITFETDGPYKTMIIPSSTEENHLIKKRYAIFGENNSLVELKGFELKRRGELNFVKRFQEELFKHFNDGNSLEECYTVLGRVCDYWLDIINAEGATLDEAMIFDLFSESRSMSKTASDYGSRKSNILGTAHKIAEFLGKDMLEDKLKCEFIISRFPENRPTAERAIPIIIFKHPQREFFLKKWLGCNFQSIHKIVDWGYYRKRFESIVQRMICIPAFFQGVANPVPRVPVPKWILDSGARGRLRFATDLEDCTKRGRTFLSSRDPPHAANNPPSLTKKASPSSVPAASTAIERSLIGIAVDPEGGNTYQKTYSDGSIVREPIVRNIYIDINDSENIQDNFSSYNKISFCTTEIPEYSTFIEMNVLEQEYFSEKYQKFFGHFAIRKAYSAPKILYQLIQVNKDPCALSESGMAIITSFTFDNKAVFCISTEETVFITEGTWYKKVLETEMPLDSVRLLTSSLNNYRKKNAKEIKIVVTDRSTGGAASEVFRNIPVLELPLALPSYLERLTGTMKRHSGWHLRLREEASKMMELATKYAIPVMNVILSASSGYFDVLDTIFYRELMASKVLPEPASRQMIPSLLEDEQWRSGYNQTYCVEMECFGTAILAVVEQPLVIDTFCGLERTDFQVLSKILKGFVIGSVSGSAGDDALLRSVSLWMKTGSNLISDSLNEILAMLQRRYMAMLLSELKKLQCKVVGVSRELLIIDTGKKERAGCDAYVHYIRRKISAVPGFELLKLRLLRCFEKLALVDFDNYFYVEDGRTCRLSQVEVPSEFFEMYFTEKEILNEQVYDIITKIPVISAKMLLRLLSYKRNTHGLASNCYKLLKVSEFEESPVFRLKVPLFCEACGFENMLRSKCLKCHSRISRERQEQVAEEYLQWLWACERSRERHCPICGAGEEKRLKEYCRCGGKLVKKDYRKEIDQLSKFINTRRFTSLVESVYDYFN